MNNKVNIEQVIERINYLYKKSQEEGLTPEEKDEQKQLREIYLNNFRKNFRSQLEGVKLNPKRDN